MKSLLIMGSTILLIFILIYYSPKKSPEVKKAETPDSTAIFMAQAKICIDSSFYYLNQMWLAKNRTDLYIFSKQDEERRPLLENKLSLLMHKLPHDKVNEIFDYQQKVNDKLKQIQIEHKIRLGIQ